MEYLIEVNEFEVITDKSLSSEEVMDYFNSGKCSGYDNVRTYKFNDFMKAKKAFEHGKDVVRCSAYKEQGYEVRSILLIARERDGESEFQQVLKECYPAIKMEA